MRSDHVADPPVDVSDAFASYNSTLRSPLDKHVPLRPSRARVRTTARWYDRDCRITKRRLERLYRRLHTTESLSAWRDQFDQQRLLFQTKFSTQTRLKLPVLELHTGDNLLAVSPPFKWLTPPYHLATTWHHTRQPLEL